MKCNFHLEVLLHSRERGTRYFCGIPELVIRLLFSPVVASRDALGFRHVRIGASAMTRYRLLESESH